MTKDQEDQKTLTIRMSGRVHKKLRVLAAMREQNLTEVIVELIEQARINDPDEVNTVKNLLYGMTGEHLEADVQDGEKRPSEDTKRTLKRRKEEASFKLDGN